jgi:predicted transcriptional regulator
MKKKIIVAVESFDEMWKRKQARARKLDQGVKIEPEFRITFERAEDLLACLTPVRVLLLAAAKKKEMSITELAERLQRTRTAVERDIKVLHRFGFIQMRKETNPGHGQVQMVRAIAATSRSNDTPKATKG